MECDVPEAMIEYQADKMRARITSMRIQAQGINLRGLPEHDGHARWTSMREQAKEGAGRSVRTNLALEAVANAEEL